MRRRLRATDVLAEIFNDSDSAESVDDSDIVMWFCMTAVKNPRRDSVVCKSHRGQGIEKRWIKGESRKQSTCVAVVQHCTVRHSLLQALSHLDRLLDWTVAP